MELPVWGWWVIGVAGYVASGICTLYLCARTYPHEYQGEDIWWSFLTIVFWPIGVACLLFNGGVFSIKSVANRGIADRKAADTRAVAKGRYVAGIPVVDEEE